jgi:tetratricopeptide (TPR) repeat protein
MGNNTGRRKTQTVQRAGERSNAIEELLTTTKGIREQPLATTKAIEQPLATTKAIEQPLATTKAIQQPLATTTTNKHGLLQTHVTLPKDRCPALHQLTQAQAPQGLPSGFFSSFFSSQLGCNICGEDVPGNTTVHSCEQCNYDVCISCFEAAATVHWEPLDAQKASEAKTQESAPQTTMNKLGISLDHLRTFKVENAWGKDADPSVYQVCEAIIKRSTSHSLNSYCEKLSSDPTTKHLVGDADFFVSYAWSYSWNSLMSALKDESGFVWIDVATVNQHFSQNINLEQWLHTFGDAISAIGRVVLVVSPWDDPTPARRSWCAFELYTATARNIPVTVRFPTAQREDFLQALGELRNGSVFQTIIGSVNVEAAKATKVADEEAIREMIRKAGVVKVNNIVLDAVKSWLMTLAEEGIRNVESGLMPPEIAYRVLDNAGSLFEIALLDATRAYELYEKSMRKANEIYPEDHPAVVMEMCNMATVLQRKAETRARAREYYEIGITRLEKREGTRKNINIITLLNNLALLALDEGKTDEAVALNKEAVDLATELLTREDPRTQTMLNNYLALLSDAKRFDEALVLAQEIVHNAEYLGREQDDTEINTDPFVAMAYNNVGEILRKLIRYEEAETYFNKAMAIHGRVYGETSGHYQDVRYNLAKLWKAQESHDDEIKQLEAEICKTVVVD